MLQTSNEAELYLGSLQDAFYEKVDLHLSTYMMRLWLTGLLTSCVDLDLAWDATACLYVGNMNISLLV